MLPEVGAAELLVIAAIALIVVGPKDLPVLLRKVGKFLAHMRSMAAEFRASFDEMARQSELDELRREVEALRHAAHQPAAAAAAHVGLDDIEREISGHFETGQTSAEAAPAPPPPEPAAEAPTSKRAPRKRPSPSKAAPPKGPPAQAGPAKATPAKAPAAKPAAKAPRRKAAQDRRS